MAVTWTVDIDVLDRAEKRIRVMATRVDDVAEDTWSRSVEGQVDLGDLAGSRDRIVSTVWNAWQQHQAEVASDAALIAGWEAGLVNALTALEP